MRKVKNDHDADDRIVRKGKVRPRVVKSSGYEAKLARSKESLGKRIYGVGRAT